MQKNKYVQEANTAKLSLNYTEFTDTEQVYADPGGRAKTWV
jgi:hypothetical protein